jgi:hypothetical protein
MALADNQTTVLTDTTNQRSPGPLKFAVVLSPLSTIAYARLVRRPSL